MNKKMIAALSLMLLLIPLVIGCFAFMRECNAIEATAHYASISRVSYNLKRPHDTATSCEENLKLSNLESVLDSFLNISTPINNLLNNHHEKVTQWATRYLLLVMYHAQRQLWEDVLTQQLAQNNATNTAPYQPDFFVTGANKGIDEISESSILAYTSTQSTDYQALWDVWKQAPAVDAFCACWQQPFEKSKKLMPTNHINRLYDIQCVKRMPVPAELLWYWFPALEYGNVW